MTNKIDTRNIKTEQIMELLAKGMTHKAISYTLGISINTVTNRMKKLKDSCAQTSNEQISKKPKATEEHLVVYKPLPVPGPVTITDLSDWKKARKEDLYKAIILTVLNKAPLPNEWIEEYNKED